jgi:hypothetical protein
MIYGHGRSFPGRSGNTGEVVNKGSMRARREGNKFRSMSGWRKIGCAGVVVTRLTSVRKFAYSEKKIAYGMKLLTEFAYHKQIYCKQKFTYKICLLGD